MANQSELGHNSGFESFDPDEPGFNALEVWDEILRKVRHRRVNRLATALPGSFDDHDDEKRVKISSGNLGIRVVVSWEESYLVEPHTVIIDMGGDEYSGKVNSITAKRTEFTDGNDDMRVQGTFSSFSTELNPNTLPFSEVMRNLRVAQEFTAKRLVVL